MEERIRALQCHICAAPHPATENALKDGWFRCRHCEAPSLVGADDVGFVAEGPKKLVCKGSPGKLTIVVPSGRVITPRTFLEVLIAGDLVLSLVIWGLERAGLHYVRVPLFLIGATIMVRALLHLLAFQRLELSRDRMIGYRAFGGFHFRKRTASLRYHPKNPVLPKASLEESNWIKERVLEWIERGAKTIAFSCPGCGAPVPKTVLDVHSHTCDWCGCGLVLSADKLTLGALSLPQFASGPLSKGFRQANAGGKTTFYVAPAALRWHPMVTTLLVLLLWGVIGVPITIGLAGIAALPIMLLTKTLFFALGAAILGALVVGLFYSLFSETRFVIDDTSVTSEVRLLNSPVRASHVPLARITAIETKPNDKTPTLKLRTPHRTLELSFAQSDKDGSGTLWAAVLDDLRSRPILNARLI
jgi:hypothetical protein